MKSVLLKKLFDDFSFGGKRELFIAQSNVMNFDIPLLELPYFSDKVLNILDFRYSVMFL